MSDTMFGIDPYNGAFTIELNLSDGCNVQSFGKRTVVAINESDIIYQTPTSYSGGTIPVGTLESGNESLRLFAFKDSYKAPIALYQLFIFNRTLSDGEIEWVKTNLIETEQ